MSIDFILYYPAFIFICIRMIHTITITNQWRLRFANAGVLGTATIDASGDFWWDLRASTAEPSKIWLFSCFWLEWKERGIVVHGNKFDQNHTIHCHYSPVQRLIHQSIRESVNHHVFLFVLCGCEWQRCRIPRIFVPVSGIGTLLSQVSGRLAVSLFSSRSFFPDDHNLRTMVLSSWWTKWLMYG